MDDIERDYEWLTFFRTLEAIARDHGLDDIADVADWAAAEIENDIVKQETEHDDDL